MRLTHDLRIFPQESAVRCLWYGRLPLLLDPYAFFPAGELENTKFFFRGTLIDKATTLTAKSRTELTPY